MLGNYFKETFCDMTKTKVCATSMEVDFNFYTEPGIYEIYEDCGSGLVKLYLLTVDKPADSACVTQTRVCCGKVESRQQTSATDWTEWKEVTGAENAVAVGTGVGSVVQVVPEEYVQPKATARSAAAFGENTAAGGVWSHTEGYGTKANQDAGHAEGRGTLADGRHCHSEGDSTKAYGRGSHAEGDRTIAGVVGESVVNDRFAHAEGGRTHASGLYAHAEGENTTAEGQASHAEGYYSKVELTEEAVTAHGAHAEGWKTTASANGAHSEGNQTQAFDIGAHAEGGFTEARKKYSHAGGRGTIAARSNQYVIGQYNEVSETALFLVGCGTDEENRKNAFVVDLDADGNPVYDFGGARFTPDMIQSVLSLASMSAAEGVEF